MMTNGISKICVVAAYLALSTGAVAQERCDNADVAKVVHEIVSSNKNLGLNPLAGLAVLSTIGDLRKLGRSIELDEAFTPINTASRGMQGNLTLCSGDFRWSFSSGGKDYVVTKHSVEYRFTKADQGGIRVWVDSARNVLDIDASKVPSNQINAPPSKPDTQSNLQDETPDVRPREIWCQIHDGKQSTITYTPNPHDTKLAGNFCSDSSKGRICATRTLEESSNREEGYLIRELNKDGRLIAEGSLGRFDRRGQGIYRMTFYRRDGSRVEVSHPVTCPQPAPIKAGEPMRPSVQKELYTRLDKQHVNAGCEEDSCTVFRIDDAEEPQPGVAMKKLARLLVDRKAYEKSRLIPTVDIRIASETKITTIAACNRKTPLIMVGTEGKVEKVQLFVPTMSMEPYDSLGEVEREVMYLATCHPEIKDTLRAVGNKDFMVALGYDAGISRERTLKAANLSEHDEGYAGNLALPFAINKIKSIK